MGANLPRFGLKDWRSRATETDGNPPANPSSSQPIITSQWPRALLPKAAFSSSSLPPPSFALSEREWWCSPQAYYHFKDFAHKSMSTWLPYWSGGRGGATLTDSKCLWKLRRWEAFYHYPAKTQGQIFLTLLHSCFGPTTHAVSGVQSRAIKGTSHGKKEAFSVIQYFYRVLCWVTTSNFLGCECAPNVRSFNLLALALRLMLAFIQFNVGAYIVSPVHLDQRVCHIELAP